MKFDRNFQPLMKSTKPRQREYQAKSQETLDFEAACRAAGVKPATVRRRMSPKHEGGQGLSLEEALATPTRTRSQCGTAAREHTPWGQFEGDDS